MVEKRGALQGHAPEMVGDAPLMRKGLMGTPPSKPSVRPPTVSPRADAMSREALVLLESRVEPNADAEYECRRSLAEARETRAVTINTAAT